MCNMEWAGQGREKVPCQCTSIISRDKGEKSTLHAPHHLHPPAAQSAWPSPPLTEDTWKGIQSNELKSLLYVLFAK